jgi:hypothetical protein
MDAYLDMLLTVHDEANQPEEGYDTWEHTDCGEDDLIEYF